MAAKNFVFVISRNFRKFRFLFQFREIQNKLVTISCIRPDTNNNLLATECKKIEIKIDLTGYK